MSAGFRVALTFDAEHPDRPNDGLGAARIIETLAAAQTTGTFFVQGRWAEANPTMARRIVTDGHLVGSHSQYHARMPLFTPRGFATDVRAAEGAIRRVARVDPRPWFRLPFGSGATSPEVIAALAALGYRHVGWHVDVKEWRRRETIASVRDRALELVRAHGDGAIVLLHTWPDPVGLALPALIERLASDGARFVRVDELGLGDGLEPVAEPRPADATTRR
ncbi:MAG TPA: polysaccharide deacetylase family protein [Candidatus Limnocylindria bacterium]|nr:polysaccharide deacetylase family protein [Candidatus Limnocylindria bacterium]